MYLIQKSKFGTSVPLNTSYNTSTRLLALKAMSTQLSELLFILYVSSEWLVYSIG